MTKAEALVMLGGAPASDKPCRLNKALTEAQFVGIVRDAINSPTSHDPLDNWLEHRVWQAYKNRPLRNWKP